MAERPAKTTKNAVGAASAKASGKSGAAGGRTTKRRKVSHDDIATRAYFIHLEQGEVDDEVENWLRAERELAAS
ncbi:MAG TPA: DUF2934 domain-containing protein [Solirubrobacteraceae bacterium]|jgi:hypothetical protein|nr:DUF2934 domain-containing protein [Solirubrobacteraceae bacterium]